MAQEMEKMVADLKKLFKFKDSTETGDIVIIAAQEPRMLVYAQVAGFERDQTKRDEWWHVSLHILTMPPQKVTWTLRSAQFTGMEIFTMDGNERFMKAIALDGGVSEKDGVLKQKPHTARKTVLRRVK